MPYFDENGDYVLENGTVVPMGGFNAYHGISTPAPAEQPVMSVAGEPEPALPVAPLPSAAPTPAPVPAPVQATVTPAQPVFSGVEQSAPVPAEAPVDDLPPLYKDDLSLTQRTNRTAKRMGSLGGLNQDLAENIENFTDHAQSAAELTQAAELKDAGHLREAELASYKENMAANEAARIAHSELNKRTAEVEERAARLRQELEDFQLDPNRVFRKQGSFATLADIVAVGFGAMAQHGNGGVNVGLQLVNKKIEDDMRAQESRQANTMSLYKNLPQELQYVRSIYDNEIAADATERAFKLKAVENLLKAKMAETTNVRAAANLQMAYAKIVQQRIENEEKARASTLQVALKSMDLKYQREKDNVKKAPVLYQAPHGRLVLTTKDANGRTVQAADTSAGVPIGHLKPEQQDAVHRNFALSKSALDARENLKAMGLDGPELLDEHVPATQQQIMSIIADIVTGNGARAISDTDAQYIVGKLGLPADMNPDGVKTWLKQQSGEGLLHRLTVAAESSNKASLGILNSFRGDLPAGTEYAIEGIEASASPAVTTYWNNKKADPGQKANKAEDRSLENIRKGQVSGLALLGDDFLTPATAERRKPGELLKQAEKAVLAGTLAARERGDKRAVRKFFEGQAVVEQARKVQELRWEVEKHRGGGPLKTTDQVEAEEKLEAETERLKELQVVLADPK
jgi:hypothetical protein